MRSSILSSPPISEYAGIQIYTKHSYYWGVGDRETMRSFLASARSIGFFESLGALWTSDKQKTYADQWDRSSFHFLLPIAPDAVILDLGSGYGNNTIPLARYYGHVVAADATRELLEYTSLRAKAEGVKNIDFINIDPLEYLNLPFQPKSFDAIIVSGLLEWVGSATTDVSPDVSQQRVLCYLRTLLKEGGVLYIGIENRLFPGFFGRDPHTKLPYTCVMPRFLANWYARRHGWKDGYRTYVYSKVGYKNMLTRAGFKWIDFYYPQPNYRNPVAIFSDQKNIWHYLRSHGYLKQVFTPKWSFFLSITDRLGLGTFFLSSFMMVTGEGVIDKTPSILRRVLLQPELNARSSDIVVRVPDSSASHCRFLVFHSGEEKPYGQILAPHLPQNSTEPLSVMLFEPVI